MLVSYRWIKILLTAACLLPRVAPAAGQAFLELGHVEVKGETRPLVLEFNDDKQIRVEAPGQLPGYWLIHHDATYHVTATGVDRVTAPEHVRPPLSNFAFADVAELISLDELTREAQHAGMRGQHHLLTYRNAEGRVIRQRLVLSPDARARELTQILQRVSKALGPTQPLPKGAQQLQAELQQRRLGILALQDEFVLRSFGETRPAVARLSLPDSGRHMAARRSALPAPVLEGTLGPGSQRIALPLR